MTHHSNPGRKLKDGDASAESSRVLRLSIPVEKKQKAYELAKKQQVSLSKLIAILLDQYRHISRD